MMYVAKKHLSRRALLKGASGFAGAAVPGCHASGPFAPSGKTAAAPVRRLGIIYYFGGATDRWLPTGEGANFTLATGTAPLERHNQSCCSSAGCPPIRIVPSRISMTAPSPPG